MNEVVNQLLERKSVRVFLDREISPEDRDTILLCASNAPSAGNQQMYSIIDVRDEQKRKELSLLCDNQAFIAQSKLVLVFCADWRKWYDSFLLSSEVPRKPQKGDLLLAVSDANIAAQNAVVAAHSLGLGSCYIGDVMENCEKMRALLNLPKYVFPCAMLVFGYPTEQQKQRKKPVRFDLSDLVFVDSYETRSEETLRRMHGKNCTNMSFEDWITAFCKRKYNSDFSREMQRSVNEYLKDFEN